MLRLFSLVGILAIASCATVGIKRQYGLKERVKEIRGCKVLDSLVIRNELGGVHKEVWYECWCREEKEKLEYYKQR